ncbi:hypothetical protein T484DRAFT_1954082 [Baffinella frigidus]|nr:hypothetical protein T484DRAFT_1954082 [Cryptophyta sp. CCMP2293]
MARNTARGCDRLLALVALACFLAIGGSTAMRPALHTLAGKQQPRRACPATLAGPLRLRGGGDAGNTTDAVTDLDETRAAEWSVEEVLRFVESLRGTFSAKTDGYKTIFEENDIDGKVLLNLDDDKLAKVGVKSLGHREHLVEALVSLRSRVGMRHGPRPGEFEAAMRAQNAPPPHPPKLLSKTDGEPAAEGVGDDPFAGLKWKNAERTAWDQQGREVEYYLLLDGVGKVAKEDVSVTIEEQSLEIRVQNLNGTNYLHRVPKLFSRIKPDKSFWKVRADRIDMRLHKATEGHWAKIFWDPIQDRKNSKNMETAKSGNPAEGLMGVLKDLYQEGDPDMQRIISQSFSKARAAHASGKDPMELAGGMGENMPPFAGMPGFEGGGPKMPEYPKSPGVPEMPDMKGFPGMPGGFPGMPGMSGLFPDGDTGPKAGGEGGA